MGLEETKHLLRSFRIVPNKLLGQNFMIEPSVFPKLCEYSCLGRDDVVLDAGAGFGFLTRFLAWRCKAVVAVEKDPRVALVLREQVQGYVNVTVVQGDVLKAELPAFNKVIAIPPYYLSSRLMVWLLQRQPDCSVLILQKEFADRLLAPVGTENYGWLTVVAFHDARVELLDAVPKIEFYPQPPVDSVIVRLAPWETAPFQVKDAKFFNGLVRWLFTQRNRRVSNSLAPFVRSKFTVGKKEAEKLARDVPFASKRVRELSPREFGELANVLAK
jgi:16S rRNA (adenine1518-N6/adenine1519-N6)-dimethyltransferase